MKSLDNSALFTNISAEESSTVNGGLLISKPRFGWKIVKDSKTGKFTIKFPVFRGCLPQLVAGSNFSILK